MIIRVGVPYTGGRILEAAVAAQIPIMVSAGSLWNNKTRRFRRPGSLIWGYGQGINSIRTDVALDSAGFVAMKLYGHYPWSVSDYIEHCVLASCVDPHVGGWFPWRWWSQMDLCCEPEIASDRETVMLRVKGTADLLEECRSVCNYWYDQGYTTEMLPYPMPILQGWRPEDYEKSGALLDSVVDGSWPALVGVGSVCRRHLHGPEGLIAVLTNLDRVLPKGVGLHLFGVKGDAIAKLIHIMPHRIHSVDSMAWDFAARMEAVKAGIPKTVDQRVGHMMRWMSKNLDASRLPAQQVFRFDNGPELDVILAYQALLEQVPDTMLPIFERLDANILSVMRCTMPREWKGSTTL